jgi:hypothetical protein
MKQIPMLDVSVRKSNWKKWKEYRKTKKGNYVIKGSGTN